jgi:hypothetical protein
VNLLGDNTETIKKNTETLTDASKGVGLEISIEKAKYMLSHHQIAGKNQDIKKAIRSFGKFVTVQIFADNSNKPKFDLGGN